MKAEMICACGCEKVFIPHYWNGILVSKLHPNCLLKSLQNKARANMVASHEKHSKSGTEAKKQGKTTIKRPTDKKLDLAWSKLVKLRAGNKCAVCDSEKALNSHHIYSRAKISLRWSLENGICLCVGCHIGSKFSAHKTPVDFNDWLYKHYGPEFMDGLKLMAHTQSNLHEFEKEVLLKELQSEILKFTK